MPDEEGIDDSTGMEVKDEVCDTIEDESCEADNQDMNLNAALDCDESSKPESEENTQLKVLTREKDETTDSTKDSKSSSDQENIKQDALKKLKKKARGKARLTMKTNKSKKFAVVQSDIFIKNFNKAINDDAEATKSKQSNIPDESSLVLRKTERERPLSKRLLQKKLLRTKLKELGKKLLED